jgi:hypothetical protein
LLSGHEPEEQSMEYTTYAARMTYLDAGDVDAAVVDYDGLPVRGPAGETLGHIDGFVVDAQAGRLYYIVVDSGGWFRSRRFLLPVGHASLDADRAALSVDVPKDALSKYPEFDADRFRQFSDEDLHQFEQRMSEACCPEDRIIDESGGPRDSGRRHYVQPSWWDSTAPIHERSQTSHAHTGKAAPMSDEQQRESARDRGGERSPGPEDVSPHYGGRAQPGDVLGIETGGEVTALGDEAADEDRRRREALAAMDDEPRQSER